MKQYKNLKKLLALVLVLALALTTPLQASEVIPKDTAEVSEAEIVDEPGLPETAPVQDSEPAETVSSPGSFVTDVEEVPSDEIPDNAKANTISAPPQTGVGGSEKSDEPVEKSDESAKTKIEFYLDWNGIDGLFGHCLTCTRGFEADETPMFTAKDAAVYGLNFKAEYDEEAVGAAWSDQGALDVLESPEDQWEFLQQKWSEDTFDGYTFLGWSTQPTGGKLITADTPLENGMSFYAYWKKGDESNETFQRIDPAAGPLEAIRILAGADTQFNSGTLHAGKHAAEGARFSLDLFYTPVRAEIKDITWNVKVYKEVSLAGALLPGQAAETLTVEAGKMGKSADGGVTVAAKGCNLTVTDNDGQEHVVVVRATAKGANGQEFQSLSDATLGFSHSWDQGNVTQEATCTEKGHVQYHCTVCGATKEKDIPALEHVYNKNRNLNTGFCDVTVIKPATCTEDGVNEYTFYCLRCKAPKKPETGKVPALGHNWSETVKAPASCNKDTETRHCLRCGLEEASLVPAYHPELHVWKETNRYHETCMSDYVYERCEVCGETRSRTEAANNPDRHSYAYESSVRNDCYLVTYTFRCVHGCGSTQVMLKREEGHAWSGWTTSASMDRTTGMMKRIRTRVCSRCGKKETEDLGSDRNSSPVNYVAANSTATAVAPAAASDTSAAKAKVKAKAKAASPAKTAFSYAKSKSKKKVTLQWKKSSGATGYQVQYSLKKNFSSGVGKKTTKKLNLTVSKLKSKKTYYFRVRAYRKSGKTTVYSAWSTVKKVKVK